MIILSKGLALKGALKSIQWRSELLGIIDFFVSKVTKAGLLHWLNG